MLLFIDNFDSFSHNLIHCFETLGAEVQTYRHNALTVDQALALGPSHIVLGPGPGDPSQAGISCDLIRRTKGEIPILGVCLGHQCIGEVFGAQLERAPRVMHGKTSAIRHSESGLFADIPQDFTATRYHSLCLDPKQQPDCLEWTAFTEEGELMGLQHRSLPIYGVQFHPESVLSVHGPKVFANFLKL